MSDDARAQLLRRIAEARDGLAEHFGRMQVALARGHDLDEFVALPEAYPSGSTQLDLPPDLLVPEDAIGAVDVVLHFELRNARWHVTFSGEPEYLSCRFWSVDGPLHPEPLILRRSSTLPLPIEVDGSVARVELHVFHD